MYRILPLFFVALITTPAFAQPTFKVPDPGWYGKEAVSIEFDKSKEEEKRTTAFAPSSFLKKPHTLGFTSIALTHTIVKGSAEDTVTLVVANYCDTWVNFKLFNQLQTGKSIFIMDGKKRELKGRFRSSISSDIKQKHNCQEFHVFQLSLDEFMRFANSKKIEVQIGHIEFVIDNTKENSMLAFAANLPRTSTSKFAIATDPDSTKKLAEHEAATKIQLEAEAKHKAMQSKNTAKAEEMAAFEKRARSAVDAAKKLMKRKPDLAKKKLLEFAEKYKGTEAAKEARKLTGGIK